MEKIFLSGGNGNDEMSGGSGADSFQCGTVNDKITDFKASEGDKKKLTTVNSSNLEYLFDELEFSLGTFDNSSFFPLHYPIFPFGKPHD
jgi:Ca2+-binding RTX toxin-like protein